MISLSEPRTDIQTQFALSLSKAHSLYNNICANFQGTRNQGRVLVGYFEDMSSSPRQR